MQMFCNNCGFQNDDGAMSCRSCGAELEAPEAAPVPEAAPAAPAYGYSYAAPQGYTLKKRRDVTVLTRVFTIACDLTAVAHRIVTVLIEYGARRAGCIHCVGINIIC